MKLAATWMYVKHRRTDQTEHSVLSLQVGEFGTVVCKGRACLRVLLFARACLKVSFPICIGAFLRVGL